MKYLTALLFAFALTGCAMRNKEPMITMHVDTSFTMPERQCLEASADQWRYQTSEFADVEFKYDFNSHSVTSVGENFLHDRVVRWTSDNPTVKAIEEANAEPGSPYMLLGQVNGHHLNDEVRLPIEMRLVADRLGDAHTCRLTAIHELGHVFGLPHMAKATDIMFPAVMLERTECLKKDELTLFSYLDHGTNIEMKPCDDQPDSDFPELSKAGPADTENIWGLR
jgi:hypothetical protein